MLENKYYTQAMHGPFQIEAIGDLDLEFGGCLPSCQLAFATFGTLNRAKNNAILVPTWFAGASKVMEQAYIGAGRALDPARYFIIVVNQIGGGLSTSPHNLPGPLGMAGFPRVSIGDDVVAQERLLRLRFGIDRLALVMGGAMGAQQTYEWAVRFPDKVLRAAPIAGVAKTTPHNFLWVAALADAITSDPAWDHGTYKDPHAVREGLRRHSRLWAVMGLSPAILKTDFWRAVGLSSLDDLLVNFLDATFLPMDPSNLILMARKWQDADVSRHAGGDLAAALSRITAKMTVMPISSDMVFPTADCAAEQAMIADSTLTELQTAWGHVGLFGLDPSYAKQVDAALRALLARPV
jgi:homoserine O-acetyltransferase